MEQFMEGRYLKYPPICRKLALRFHSSMYSEWDERDEQDEPLSRSEPGAAFGDC
jgi:hypothetical protein